LCYCDVGISEYWLCIGAGCVSAVAIGVYVILDFWCS
jgi:hypothetical protein